MTNEVTREMLADEIKNLDPALSPDDPAYHAAMVLLASLTVGPNVRNVAAFTGYPLREVAAFGQRLRNSAVWVGHKIACEWFEEDRGVLAFWCDVNVALGFMERH